MDAVAAAAEACEDFVSDRTGAGGSVVHREVRANQFEKTAAPDCTFREIGYVEHRQVHRYTAEDRRGLAVCMSDRSGLAVGGPETAEEAVRIADGDRRIARVPLERQGRAVTDRLARASLADLRDTAIE